MRTSAVFLAAFLSFVFCPPLQADAASSGGMTAEIGSLKIHRVWSRATPPGAGSGVTYLAIENTGDSDDVLKAVTSSAAANAMIHETRMTGGVMTMSHMMSLPIPAGGTVELKPGGLHVMLTGLSAPLKAGVPFRLTLTFEKAGEITLDVPVLAPGKTLELTH